MNCELLAHIDSGITALALIGVINAFGIWLLLMRDLE